MKLTPEQREEIGRKADRAQARSTGVAPNGHDSSTTGDAADELIRSILTQDQIDAEIERLAALPTGVYESERVAAA
jgi:hypothetical protein